MPPLTPFQGWNFEKNVWNLRPRWTYELLSKYTQWIRIMGSESESNKNVYRSLSICLYVLYIVYMYLCICRSNNNNMYTDTYVWFSLIFPFCKVWYCLWSRNPTNHLSFVFETVWNHGISIQNPHHEVPYQPGGFADLPPSLGKACDQRSRSASSNHHLCLLGPQNRALKIHEIWWTYCWWFRNLALVEVGSLAQYLRCLLHPRWLFRSSSINSISFHLSTDWRSSYLYFTKPFPDALKCFFMGQLGVPLTVYPWYLL